MFVVDVYHDLECIVLANWDTGANTIATFPVWDDAIEYIADQCKRLNYGMLNLVLNGEDNG